MVKNARKENLDRLDDVVKIIERNQLDEDQWDKLVAGTPESTFFSNTWYLDATADNWCVLVNADYTFGIALPYTKKFGIEVLYTPIFVRYIELLSLDDSVPSYSTIEAIIKQRFTNISISIRQPLLGETTEKFIFQAIPDGDERKIGSQAKRMLNKARKNEILVEQTTSFKKVLDIIRKELMGKHAGLTEQSMITLEHLFNAAYQAGVLTVYSLPNDGGIVCLEKEHYCLYLKGTTTESTKTIGGMYTLLNSAIENAISSKRTFDFGGSRAEGVKRFNKNLGGQDIEYYNYTVDKTPFWFKFARRIKHSWKK